MKLSVFILLSILTYPALSKLITLGAERNVVSYQARYPGLSTRAQNSDNYGLKQTNKSAYKKPVLLPTPYPVKTELLLEAQTQIYKLETYYGTPLCLIANNNISKQWLIKNREIIKKLNARCFVIEANSDRDLVAVRKWAKPVLVALLPSSKVLTDLGIWKYPAILLSKDYEIK